MTDRNNAPAGKLVTTGEKPTETGRPMLLGSKWMVKAGLAMCDETDHEDAYLAMDVKSKTEWLQRVLQIAEEQEE